MKSLQVHMLWKAGELTRLARLSLASFLHHGYRITLWSDEPETYAGMGVEVCHAAELVADGSDIPMACFSNLFRYKVLAERGGVWADMDMLALSAEPGLAAVPSVASEKRRPFRHTQPSATGESLTQVTNCLMVNPTPSPGDLWHRAAAHVAALAPDDQTWEKSGPHLLTELLLADAAHGIAILPTQATCPVSWWNVPMYLLDEREPPASPFLHMYASVWAKRGGDAEAPFPARSLLGKLWRLYGL